MVVPAGLEFPVGARNRINLYGAMCLNRTGLFAYLSIVYICICIKGILLVLNVYTKKREQKRRNMNRTIFG